MKYLIQVFEDEIMDEETYKTIYDFITLDNFRSGEYEGNTHIFRKIDRTYIQIEDEVAFENTGKRRVEGFNVGFVSREMKAYWESNKEKL
ncbi:hypothetical protein MKY84_13555 [Chryseomicrobium sp. FSL W7-1435]|uniref:hypothetical protein n=1 Tax=Chryseomicrobium sp. FSL W7-1435 TaxID=2921704 RepID=UPI00315AFABD